MPEPSKELSQQIIITGLQPLFFASSAKKLDQAISFLIMKVATKKVTIKKISKAKTSG